MKDLTKGPLFKTLVLFAIPIFFGNLFQLFFGFFYFGRSSKCRKSYFGRRFVNKQEKVPCDVPEHLQEYLESYRQQLPTTKLRRPDLYSIAE